MKQQLLDNLKNIPGWKTHRKILVISVDDYGNVRLDSKKARENMDRAGLKVKVPFDQFDSLETREDLEYLFEILTSVKDRKGKPAVFTPFALPCNIDFEAMEAENYQRYIYELLPETYKKLASKDPEAYSGAWELWQQGIKQGLMKPQFHGREHLNLKIFEEKLRNRDHEVLTALKNRSYTSISNTGYATISYTAAFDFWEFKENEKFDSVISDGLQRFQEVYGEKAVHFNPPGGREHPEIHKALKKNGIKYLDTPFVKHEHKNKGKYRKVLNFTGKESELGLIYEVRNVVFEPFQERGVDWVQFSLRQIETAFKWKKPAILSSHRINFCGHIDPKNRENGLKQLKKLLHEVVKKWPDVEFMSANELGDLITKEKGKSGN